MPRSPTTFLLNTSFGAGRPLSCVKRGLGSNVSTCDGPPGMNRKITRLARGGKCGARGASGPGASPGDCATALSWSCSSETKANDPKPPPMRLSQHRRLNSIDIDHLVRAEDQMAEIAPSFGSGLLGQVLATDHDFGRRRSAPERNIIEPGDAFRLVGRRRIARHAFGQHIGDA